LRVDYIRKKIHNSRRHMRDAMICTLQNVR